MVDFYNPYTIRIIGGVIGGLLLLAIRYGIRNIGNYLMELKKRSKGKAVTKKQELKIDQELPKKDFLFDIWNFHLLI